jgi:P2 family phage contractile tail tube protein
MREGIAALNNVFIPYDLDTNKPLKGTVSTELPNFELLSETFKGAGIAGEINVPASGNMSALTAVLNFAKIYGDITKYLEVGTTRTVDLRNDVIVKNVDTHMNEKVPERWVLKGPISGANPGSVEQAAAGDASVTMQVYYAQHFLDGEEILEFDVSKYILKVNGKDLMEDTRKNILA